MSKSSVQKVVIVTCAALQLVSCTSVPAQKAAVPQRDQFASSLQAAQTWLSTHLVQYRFRSTYEIGDDSLSHGQAGAECKAVRSFDITRDHTVYPYLGRYGRSMLYDNAVAVIALTMQGKFTGAKGVLASLEHLQNSDGSLGFSFNTYGDNFYNRSYLRTGAICWAGYAAVFYQLGSGDATFQPFAERIASWVLKQQALDTKDMRYGLVTGGWGTWDMKTWQRIIPGRLEWCATEHQIDTYFFLRDLGKASGKGEYTEAAMTLSRSVLERLWCEEEGRFYMGFRPDGPDKSRALDTCSWGTMFLLAAGEAEKAKRCVEYLDSHYRSESHGVKGYRPYDGYIADYENIPEWSDVHVVWSEGSHGVAMAYLKLGDRDRAREVVKEMLKLQAPQARLGDTPKHAKGGLYYVTDELTDFLACPSAAGTGWHVMTLLALGSDKQLNSFWGPGR